MVRKHAATICAAAERTVKYLHSAQLVVEPPNLLINSDFFVDHAELLPILSSQSDWLLGPLLDGHEFLAVVFFKDE
jgi:hypothetical protein